MNFLSEAQLFLWNVIVKGNFDVIIVDVIISAWLIFCHFQLFAHVRISHLTFLAFNFIRLHSTRSFARMVQGKHTKFVNKPHSQEKTFNGFLHSFIYGSCWLSTLRVFLFHFNSFCKHRYRINEYRKHSAKSGLRIIWHWLRWAQCFTYAEHHQY